MINIKVEQFKENNEYYYLVTSEDIQGLIAEGSTVEEAVSIAQSLIYDLLEIRKEINKEDLIDNIKFSDIPKVFHQPLFIQAGTYG